MPARSIDELNITNFVDTGLNTGVPRYTFMLEVRYTNSEGEQLTHGPRQYTYPNDIASMPLAVRKKFAIAMITAVARVTLGTDTWNDYL